MVARLAWRLSGLAGDAHPSNGDSMKITQIALEGVYLPFKLYD
jgi:hypothetical protein